MKTPQTCTGMGSGDHHDAASLERPVGIVGLGAYVPQRVMTNHEWAEWVDTSDEWIRTRTGIEERRIAADDESTLDLAQYASVRALEHAGLTATEVDEIIVATDTPDLYLPDTAALLQHRLGAREVPCYDLGRSGCAGFVQALDIARSRVLTGARRVLVVGAELITRLFDWRDREICVLFGDAAGAAVVTGEEPWGVILGARVGTDGGNSDLLTLRAGGTRVPFSPEVASQRLHQKIEMQGRQVFRHAVTRMTESGLALLADVGVEVRDLALVVPHQANRRILDAVAKALDLPPERVMVNIERFGNTGSASIPLALSQANDQGRIQPGDLVLLLAFGAGFHWAAMLLRFC